MKNASLRFWNFLKQTSWKQRAFYVAGSLFALLVAIRLLQSLGIHVSELASSSQAPPQKAVAVTSATSRELQKTFSTQTTLQPKQEVILRPPAQVLVKSVMVKWGERVKKGQTLVTFDGDALRIRKEMERLELESKSAEFNVARALAEKQYVSGQEFAQKKMEFRAHQLRQKLSDLESTRALIAPIDGVVAEVLMKPGDFIDGNGKAMVRIVDPSLFRTEVYVPQKIALQLKSGAPVDFMRGQDKLAAKITAVSPVVDAKTGSVLVEAAAAPLDIGWISGMFVEVHFILESHSEALSVPSQAVVFQNEKPYVYRVIASEEEPKVEKRELSLGINDGDFYEVKSGIEEFDEIVVQGQGQLSDGDTVRIAE